MASCPVCVQSVSGPPVEAATSPYHFMKCEACDLVFTDPMPSVDGDWYSRQEMYLVRDHIAAPKLQWNHKQFLEDMPLNGGRLLDVGCGTGEFLAAAAKAGYQVYGFDFDSNAVKTAAERFGLKNVFTGDLQTLQSTNPLRQFDVVTAFEILEHSPTPAQFMTTIAGLLKPNGFLALSVPNRNRWPRFRYSWDYPPNHLTRWSQRALVSFLEKNGFWIVRVATGWRQGESFLHQNLQFGIVTRLLRKKESSSTSENGSHNSSGFASVAYQVKATAIRYLSFPMNVGLGLIGETGMTIYILAQKKNEK